MAPQVTKRQPLSCENCRRRKIKCTGEQPCETCVHRGFSHTCFYMRQGNAPAAAQVRSGDVLERVKKVELLLEKQIKLMERHFDPVLNSTVPTSNYTAMAHQTLPSTAGPVLSKPNGSIVTNVEGYQRYIPGLTLSDGSAVNEMIQSGSSPALSSNFPFSTDSKSTRQSLLEVLPPVRQCEELKIVFMNVFSPLFHVLHDPTFEAEYASFRQRPGEVSLSFLALLFVVLSIAVTGLDDGHPLLNDLGLELSAAANIKSLAEKYRSAAMKCLSADQFLWQHNLHTVQALVLLIYALNHAHGPAWALLGTTFNIAVSIGCHVDTPQLNLTLLEREQRRRCWAALMLLYTIQNTCLGNIAPIKVTANVCLPADVDDEAIDSLTHDWQLDSQLLDRATPTKMSYILYKFRLYELAADICHLSHNGQDMDGIVALDHRISREEEDHRTRFTDSPSSASFQQQLPIYHQAHYYILNNYTNHLRLLLHRPSLTSMSSSATSSSQHTVSHDQQILQSRHVCRTSALAILSNHAHLYETDSFRPYRWFLYGIGGFHAVLAASTLVVLLSLEQTSPLSSSSSSEHQHHHQRDPDPTPVLMALKKCHARFEHMSARSDICARAARIIGRLLYAAPSPTSIQESPGIHMHDQDPVEALSYSSGGEICYGNNNSVGTNSTSISSLSSSSSSSTSSSSLSAPSIHQEQHASGPPPPPPSNPYEASFFTCPPPTHLQDLVRLPPEQWLGGHGALAWDWAGWDNLQDDSSPDHSHGHGHNHNQHDYLHHSQHQHHHYNHLLQQQQQQQAMDMSLDGGTSSLLLAGSRGLI